MSFVGVVGPSSPQPSSSVKSMTAASRSHRPERSPLNLPRCIPKTGPPCSLGCLSIRYRNGCWFYLKEPDVVKTVVREEKAVPLFGELPNPEHFHHEHHLAQVVGVVIRNEHRFAENCLPVPVRDSRVEVGFGVEIITERHDTLFPCRRVFRRPIWQANSLLGIQATGDRGCG